MRKYFSFLLMTLLISLFLVRSPKNISAQEATAAASPSASVAPSALPTPSQPINITLSPATLSITTEQAKPITTEFRIRNNTDEDEVLSITVATFDTASDGALTLRDFDLGDSHRPWLSVSQEPILIPAQSWQSIPVTFSPPSDAAFSYYYALVITRTSSQTTAATAEYQGAAVMLTLGTVEAPGAQRQLELVDMKAPWLTEFLPINLEITLRNTGNVAVRPKGSVFIQSDGKDIATLSFNQGAGQILPNTSRTFSISWDQGLPRYITDAQTKETTLTWDLPLSEFRFGKYTAKAVIVYDNGSRDIPLEVEKSIYVIPWKWLLGAFVLTLLVLLGLWTALKKLIISKKE